MLTHNGFIYDVDNNGHYLVKTLSPTDAPESFFKYYPLNKNSVDALTNLYIYATHPNQFNDPFDCNINLVRFKSWDDVHNLWDDLTGELINVYPDLNDACKYSQKAYKTILYKKLGLFSLAPGANNMLMWALYAQNSGFCLEYDTKLFPFTHYGPYPINYSSNIETIDIGRYGGKVSMLYQSTVKNIEWQFEHEWRLLVTPPLGFDMKAYGDEDEKYNYIDDHDRKFKYPIHALKSIYLGPSFFNSLNSMDISQTEIEVIADEHNNPLHYNILEFISNINFQNNCQIYQTKQNGLKGYYFKPINTIKISNVKYRITSNIL